MFVQNYIYMTVCPCLIRSRLLLFLHVHVCVHHGNLPVYVVRVLNR